MAATDWPEKITSSPRTSTGRSRSFSHCGRGFGPAVVCSAIGGVVSRDGPVREPAGCRALNGYDCRIPGRWTAWRLMWLVLLLAAAPAEAARAYAMLSYVAGDYAAAVGATGEVLSAQELDEQRVFSADAAQGLRAAGAGDLAAEAERLGAAIGGRTAAREAVALARGLAGRVAPRLQRPVLPRR